MIKNRLIPCVILKNDLVVQSFGFQKYLPIGRVDAVIEFFNNWDVDEIIVIDIDATSGKRTIDLKTIERIAKGCSVPLTVGGGIRDISFIPDILNVGADKICINSIAYERPQFITEVADKYGCQFVTVSIDAKATEKGYKAYIRNGKVDTGMTVVEFAQKVEKLGAGEIFLNSIDRDGSKQGYDLEMIKPVCESVRIPVIACGGVGKAAHFAPAIQEAGCSAVSAANIFNHTELSTVAGKAFMKKSGIPIRIDSSVKYEGINFDFLDRPI